VPEPRYTRPASSWHSTRAHRFDVFGIKVNRMLTLWGRAQLDQWLALESAPHVSWYCERPLTIETDSGKRLGADFYAVRSGVEELFFLGSDSTNAEDLSMSFAHWCSANAIALSGPGEPMGQVLRANWGQIIRELAAFQRYLTPALLSAVEKELSDPRTFAELTSAMGEVHAFEVKSGALMLLHQGRAFCPELSARPLDSAMLIRRSPPHGASDGT
jgi:hypothetical protein